MTQSLPNALSSLYSSPGKALAGNVGGRVRRQEVHTPRWFLELAVFPALGGPPDLDPCAASSPESWFARENITATSAVRALEDALPMASDEDKREIRRALKACYSAVPESPWERLQSVYCNPPFSCLQPWMQWCQARGNRGLQTIGLWPVRPGNAWWIPACKGAEIVFLSARFAFEGYKSAHPEDLACVAWNCRIPDLGKWETGRWIP